MQAQMIATPIGQFAAVWTRDGLKSFEFDRSGQPPHAQTLDKCVTATHCPEFAVEPARMLLAALNGYFDSGHMEWDLGWHDWAGVSDFHRRVLDACFEIPSGETRTYKQLAIQAGSPKAARAVGGAMARNRWPILIPCHRVVGSTGKLVGYSGVGGTLTKRRLLALENRLARPASLGQASGDNPELTLVQALP